MNMFSPVFLVISPSSWLFLCLEAHAFVFYLALVERLSFDVVESCRRWPRHSRMAQTKRWRISLPNMARKTVMFRQTTVIRHRYTCPFFWCPYPYWYHGVAISSLHCRRHHRRRHTQTPIRSRPNIFVAINLCRWAPSVIQGAHVWQSCVCLLSPSPSPSLWHSCLRIDGLGHSGLTLPYPVLELHLDFRTRYSIFGLPLV